MQSIMSACGGLAVVIAVSLSVGAAAAAQLIHHRTLSSITLTYSMWLFSGVGLICIAIGFYLKVIRVSSSHEWKHVIIFGVHAHVRCSFNPSPNIFDTGIAVACCVISCSRGRICDSCWIHQLRNCASRTLFSFSWEESQPCITGYDYVCPSSMYYIGSCNTSTWFCFLIAHK